ncbi:MAG: chemotaxis protein CheV [Nevskiaceae bacterium]|nr:MAG: chemotaxis protein CheV [Nevskiaceae bacterium]TBR71554.1 MAG: chemotaxis protein CheV [Nevskiaceae bacterium]
MSTGWLDSIDRQTRLAGHNRLALLLLTLGDGAVYGVNVFKVEEILRAPPITLLPGAHPLIRGAAEIRGRPVPVIDLPRAMGCSGADPHHLVVAEFNRSVQAFLVDKVLRIVHIDVADVQPASESSPFLTSIAHFSEQYVQILDLEALLAEALGGPPQLSRHLAGSNDAKGWRILLADDSRIARSQVDRTLSPLGAQVIAVNDGRQALEWLQAQARAEQLDDLLMVISDIEMPVMDGYTLTSEIRHDPQLAHLYVLLHTSLSGDFNHSMVQQVKADRFIPKFSADELAQAVLDRVKNLQPR